MGKGSKAKARERKKKADSETFGEVEYTLRSLRGGWKDTKGSYYDVVLVEEEVEIITTRPSGQVIKTRGLVHWDGKTDWIVWGRSGTRSLYWLSELTSTSMLWERAGSASFSWERVSDPPDSEEEEDWEEVEWEEDYWEDSTSKWDWQAHAQERAHLKQRIRDNREAVAWKAWGNPATEEEEVEWEDEGEEEGGAGGGRGEAARRKAEKKAERKKRRREEKRKEEEDARRAEEEKAKKEEEKAKEEKAKEEKAEAERVEKRRKEEELQEARRKEEEEEKNKETQRREEERKEEERREEERREEQLRVDRQKEEEVKARSAQERTEAAMKNEKNDDTEVPEAVEVLRKLWVDNPERSDATTSASASDEEAGARESAHAKPAVQNGPEELFIGRHIKPKSTASAEEELLAALREGGAIIDPQPVAPGPVGGGLMATVPQVAPLHGNVRMAAAVPVTPVFAPSAHAALGSMATPAMCTPDQVASSYMGHLENYVQSFLSGGCQAQMPGMPQAMPAPATATWPYEQQQLRSPAAGMAIREQLEFYFSDQNLFSDSYLTNFMMPGDGWVSLRLIQSFPRMRVLGADLGELRQATSVSQSLEIDGTGQYVRIKDAFRRKRWAQTFP